MSPVQPTERTRRFSRSLVALSIGAMLAACGGQGDPLQAYREQTLSWQPCGTDILGDNAAVLERFDVPMEALAGRTRCALMRAPMDWSDPGKGDIQVAMMRVAAEDPSQRKGALLLNPGGPGGDGLVLAPIFAGLWGGANEDNPSGALYKRMSRSYDLVGFSPRGTGASTRLYCGSNEPLKYAANETLDRSPANLAAMMANAKLIADTCAKNPLMPYINTDATVRDMDLMRQLLGDEKLHYYGVSYGTWLGTWYAAVFPERVGRMLLSGVVRQDRNLAESFLDQPSGYQKVFDEVIVPYAARHADIFSDDGTAARVGSVFGTFDPDLQTAVSSAVVDNLGSSRNATQAALAMVAGQKVAGLLRAEDIAAALAQGRVHDALDSLHERIEQTSFAGRPTIAGQVRDLNEAARAQAHGIVELYASRVRREVEPLELSGRVATAYAVVGNDWPMAVGVDAWLAQTTLNAQRHPLAGGMFTAWPGLFWPAPSVTRPPLARATQAGTILMMHTDLDPQTPLPGAELALAAMDNARMLLVRGEHSHAPAIPYGQSCVDDPIARYFLDGSAPPRRTECSANALEWDALRGATSRDKTASSRAAPMFVDAQAAGRWQTAYRALLQRPASARPLAPL